MKSHLAIVDVSEIQSFSTSFIAPSVGTHVALLCRAALASNSVRLAHPQRKENIMTAETLNHSTNSAQGNGAGWIDNENTAGGDGWIIISGNSSTTG